MDNSETVTGTRWRAPGALWGNSEESFGNRKGRCRVGDLRLALVADRGAVRGYAVRLNPDLTSRLGANQPWVAEECNSVVGPGINGGREENAWGFGERL